MRRWIALAALPAMLTACGTTATEGHHTTALERAETISLTAAVAAPTTVQVRARFEQLLGQHAVLTIRLMRSAVDAKPDFREAAQAALTTNTNALTKLVSAGYGPAPGAEFRQGWVQHITDFFAFANGVASSDSGAQSAARQSLGAYADAFGAFINRVTKGKVPAATAAHAIDMHIVDLTEQITAFARNDYQAAYRIERAAYEHMFTTGAELVVGTQAPREKLRSQFTMLLGEHMELIVDASRAALTNSNEFEGASTQLNANTVSLTKAIAAIFGEAAGKQFSGIWATHVEGIMGYAAAVVTGVEAGKVAARRQLDAYTAQFGQFISGALKGSLSAKAVSEALTMHDEQLLAGIDAYQAADYAKASRVDLEGYDHMLDVANTLVDAIQSVLGIGLPRGGAQTGGGGTAGR